MGKMSNLNLVRSRREYTYKEIAKLFNLNIRTVQSWRKEGLIILDGTLKPVLVLGSELKRFIKEKRDRKKRNLQPVEFYCLRCREPRQSIPEKVSFILTGKIVGREKKQIKITGVCSVCSCSLNRLSSEDKVKIFKNSQRRIANV